MGQSKSDITAILVRWKDGDPEALNELAPLVMQDLRTLARRHLRSTPSGKHGLQVTDLVNDFYAHMVDGSHAPSRPWRNRKQFFGFAGKTMRNLLLSQLRKLSAKKRGGDTVHVALVESINAHHAPDEIVKIGEAVEELEQLDPLQGQIVDLMFFVGLTQAEAADALDISVFKLRREWSSAKLWLQESMRAD